MDEWKEYKFSDFVEINPTVKLPSNEFVSFVEMKDLEDGKRYCIPSSERQNGSGAKFQDNDTLFARISPCLENGKICQVKGLKNKIGLPSDLNEQRAIATILGSLDNKIDILHRQNTTLEKMAETLFRQLFVEEAKESWEEIPITNLFDVRDGTHDSPKEKVYGKKLITSKHLFSNQIDFEKAYYISIEDFEDINRRSKVDAYDILFSMIGTIGIIYLEQNQEVDYAIKNIGLFKTSQNPKWMYFLYLWLKSDFGQDFIYEHRSGSTQEYISWSIRLNIKSKEQLAQFNNSVESFFEKIKTNQSQIRILTQLRDTLLPKLMSGEVRVNKN